MDHPRGFFLILRYHAGLDGTAFPDTLAARLAADPELAAFNAAQLAVWDAHAGELPFAARHGIPCMLMEDHRSTVPFTLVTEFPDQTVYGAAFRPHTPPICARCCMRRNCCKRAGSAERGGRRRHGVRAVIGSC